MNKTQRLIALCAIVFVMAGFCLLETGVMFADDGDWYKITVTVGMEGAEVTCNGTSKESNSDGEVAFWVAAGNHTITATNGSNSVTESLSIPDDSEQAHFFVDIAIN